MNLKPKHQGWESPTHTQARDAGQFARASPLGLRVLSEG